MASNGKRPRLDADGQDGDAKRIRSANGSPAPPSQHSGISELERKKQEVAAKMAAKMAAIRAKTTAGKTNGIVPAAVPAPPPQPALPAPPAAALDPMAAKKAEAARKIAEFKAKIAVQRAQVANPVPGTPSPGPPRPGEQSDVQKRVAEAKAKLEQVKRQREGRERSGTPGEPSPPPPPPKRRGGLGIGLHPALMGDLAATVAGKDQRGKGRNQQLRAHSSNPYLDVQDQQDMRVDDAIYDPNVALRNNKERKAKLLTFAVKGKYMALGDAMREQAELEEMKRAIAEQNRKLEIEEASDKSYLIPEPPGVEWWDEGLLAPNATSYDSWETNNRIDLADGIITAYIQHPVNIQPPQEKFFPAPKPMMLTTQEQKKLRRQRRMADMKEEQAKIRLGLIEPPAPKVKKSNMMRVLGEQAVKDPTAVEARVNKEIAARANTHEKDNEERALTKEQKHEKLKKQQEEDEARGIYVCVFKVNSLSNGKHRYQVDMNAKQNNLTGIVLLNPEYSLVIVEGGSHSTQAYKKLMLNRIKWAENNLPLGSAKAAAKVPEALKAKAWLNALDERGELKDLAANKCLLVWEGEERQKMFKDWRSRVAETDGEARDILKRGRMENMWTLAKSMT